MALVLIVDEEDIVIQVVKVALELVGHTILTATQAATGEHGIRDLKDEMSREILAAFNTAGIGVASSTYDIVGLPSITVKLDKEPA